MAKFLSVVGRGQCRATHMLASRPFLSDIPESLSLSVRLFAFACQLSYDCSLPAVLQLRNCPHKLASAFHPISAPSPSAVFIPSCEAAACGSAASCASQPPVLPRPSWRCLARSDTGDTSDSPLFAARRANRSLRRPRLYLLHVVSLISEANSSYCSVCELL